MKHILIFISFLLLSSPEIGNSHKGETLFEWKTVSGIQWREIGDKDLHAEYNVDVVIGRPHGIGTLVYPDANKYVGDWMNGLFHGQGTYTNASHGYSYVGEYRIGSLWNSIMKGKDGTIDYRVVNWEKIKQ
ncbi:MAG: cytoplasmic protein [bacterium]